jgi:P27 family predicted phage terminase small subunit
MGSTGPIPNPRSISTSKRQNTAGARLPAVNTSKPPTAPKNLPKPAAAFWKRYAKDLHSVGLLTDRDAAAFTRLCCLWAQLSELDEMLTKDGVILTSPTGVQKPHPAVQMRAVAEKQFLSHSQQFSLTPGARLRIPDCEEKQPERMRRDRSIEEKYLN